MYFKEVEIMWSHLDPNQHAMNTTYSEFATHARVSFFVDHGITMRDLEVLGIGPVLLREQAVYWRETYMHERLRVSVALARGTENYSHYTIEQYIYKANGKKAAKITIDGTWLDMRTRKLALPSTEMIEKVLVKMPKTEQFHHVSPREYLFE